MQKYVLLNKQWPILYWTKSSHKAQTDFPKKTRNSSVLLKWAREYDLPPKRQPVVMTTFLSTPLTSSSFSRIRFLHFRLWNICIGGVSWTAPRMLCASFPRQSVPKYKTTVQNARQYPQIGWHWQYRIKNKAPIALQCESNVVFVAHTLVVPCAPFTPRRALAGALITSREHW